MKKIIFLSILLFLSTTFYLNGQEEPAPGRGYNNEAGNGYSQTSKPVTGTPVNVGIIVLALVGIGVAYYVREKIALR